MENNINEMLAEEIGRSIEGLKSLDVGSKEHSEGIDDVCKLYKVYIEDNKSNNDYWDKQERRELDKDSHDDEMILRDREMSVREKDLELREKDAEFKKIQLEEEMVARTREARLTDDQVRDTNKVQTWKIYSDVGIFVLGTLATAYLYHKGLKFEQTGTLTSTHVRQVLPMIFKKKN